MSLRNMFAGGMLMVASSALACETVAYAYDELGRLVRTSQTGIINNGVVTDIDYDRVGNRADYDVAASNGSGSHTIAHSMFLSDSRKGRAIT